MPSVSKSQHNLTEMVDHDPGAAQRLGIKQAVARDFVEADKGRDLSKLPSRVTRKAQGGSVKPFRW
jgi:hypothetical protein